MSQIPSPYVILVSLPSLPVCLCRKEDIHEPNNQMCLGRREQIHEPQHLETHSELEREGCQDDEDVHCINLKVIVIHFETNVDGR